MNYNFVKLIGDKETLYTAHKFQIVCVKPTENFQFVLKKKHIFLLARIENAQPTPNVWYRLRYEITE